MRDARDVLIRPVVSEKSVGMVGENKYTFYVDVNSNKIEIKNAVEKMFKVKVDNVHTLKVKPKEKRMGRYVGKTTAKKKAIVTLEPGNKIEGFAGL
ncbi:MAG: 50S ribosomal protein L23 [Gracilibacter sp. BRH_c7a]|nr:MAG: 50S ribosomal protein L23 [Gracilibacter sp. BRH_c7a]